ncbi:MAG TPA: class I SAM-dependent methyltransferase [Candidatus Polarisedimenticolia bacterium]|nr:class I SAM-dependent methyltransferase [Candidatus Polarisedimenticolia bacterium]
MSALTADEIQTLRCPRCSGGLQLSTAPAGALSCTRCRAVFDSPGGIPDLLPWSGGAPGPEWALWRDRLARLQQWRRQTWDVSDRSEQRSKLADGLATEFFKFARVPEQGTVLEIGCGGGGLRRFVPRRRYWGIDPLAGLPGSPPLSPDPPGTVFMRGVGERLPLADSTFECVLICETLDHSMDPPRVLAQAHRVLKPDGVLAVMQSVRLAAPRPPLRVRLRAAAGRLKGRLAGGGRLEDIETKVRVLGQDELSALVSERFLVESGITHDAVMFVRALRHDLSSPRRPKRPV